MKFLFSAFFILSAILNAKWIDLGNATPTNYELNIIDNSPTSLTIEYKISGFEVKSVRVGNRDYKALFIPGMNPKMVKGMPEIPRIGSSFMLPGVGSFEYSILEQDETVLKDIKVIPSRGHFDRVINWQNIPIEEGAFYRNGGVWPKSNIELSEAFLIDKVRGGSIQFIPIRFNATDNSVLVTKRIVVQITFSDTPGKNETNYSATTAKHAFLPLYKQNFINFSQFRYELQPEHGEMLVICYDDYMAEIDEWVDWKRRNGIKVTVLPKSAAGITALDIKSTIQDFYDNNPLAFVVLIGDEQQIPTLSGNFEGAPSDPSYAFLNGDDYYPDIYVSRVSAQNSAEVANQLNRFIHYEMNPDTDDDWYVSVLGIASDESGGTGLTDYERMNLIRDIVLNQQYENYTPVYDPGATSSQVTNAVNEGVSLIGYIGHGSETAWVSSGFNVGDANNLSNGHKQPFIYDVACVNGDFTYFSDCFAEAWMKTGSTQNPSGAISIYASTTNQSWVPPCIAQSEGFRLVAEKEAITIGGVAFGGLMGALDEYFGNGESDEAIRMAEQWTIFGDCSILLRTDYPAEIDYAGNNFVFVGQQSYQLTGLSTNQRATLTLNGDIIGSAAANTSGTAEVIFETPVLNAGESLTLTIVGQNAIPVTVDLPVLVPAQYSVEPRVIDINTDSEISIFVADDQGTPLVDVSIFASNYGYMSDTTLTDSTGEATLFVNYPFGPELYLFGKRNSDNYFLFRDTLMIKGSVDFTKVNYSVETNIGLTNQFGQGFEGNLSISTIPEFDNGYLTHGNIELEFQDTPLSFIPNQLAPVNVTMAKIGHNLYHFSIPVIEAIATLSGSVVAKTDSENIADAKIRLLQDGELIEETNSNATGEFGFEEEFAVGNYQIEVSKFGYSLFTDSLFLLAGENMELVELSLVEYFTFSGAIQTNENSPLFADIKIFRSDNNELYQNVSSDSLTGTFSIDLPGFLWFVTAKAPGYKLLKDTLALMENTSINYSLEVTSGLLVLSDSRGVVYKNRASKETADISRNSTGSENLIIDVLNRENLDFVNEDWASSNPAEWFDYEGVILTYGNITSGVPETLQNYLIAFVEAGGKLFVEGGELAYNHDGTTFGETVLLAADWHHDNSGDLLSGATDITQIPNLMPETMALTYDNYGSSDAVTVTENATVAGTWSTYTNNASMAFKGNQIAIMYFDLMAMDNDETAKNLVHNFFVHLEFAPLMESGLISGLVADIDGNPLHGAVVSATPGENSVVTNLAGEYVLEGLYPRIYNVSTVMEGYIGVSDNIEGVEVISGQETSDINFVLEAIVPGTISGNVFLTDEVIHDSVRVRIVGQNLSTYSDSSGYFALDNVVPGNLEMIFSKTGFADSVIIVQMQNGENIDDIEVTLFPFDGYFLDFENGSGAMLIHGGHESFFMGEPAVGGAMSGISVMATGLDGNYENNVTSWVSFPELTLGEGAHFSFWHWYDIESGYDLGTIQISTNGGTSYSVLEPLNGYPDNVSGMNCFSGSQSEWEKVEFNLSEYNGQTVVIRFYFASDAIIAKNGWYVDDVELKIDNFTSIVNADRVAYKWHLSQNYPNPFNPTTTIRFELQKDTEVLINIYNSIGQRINTLVNGQRDKGHHAIVWNGKDDRGQTVSAGIYFYQVKTPGYQQTRKMVYIK
jgi:hypothetical protein